MILDATAGNRTMWKHKNTENIIYIDIEKKLERKPTIFADNANTPFLSESFDTIFYDPPHAWGMEGHYHTYPNRSSPLYKKWGDEGVPRYYGWDIYKTHSQLAAHIYKAQKEFQRILKDGGLLWLKWNEMTIPLHKILGIFNEWQEMLRIYVKHPSQTAGKAQTYWVCLIKEKRETTQTALG